MWSFIIVIDVLPKFGVKTRCVKIIRPKKIENKRGEKILGKYQKKNRKKKKTPSSKTPLPHQCLTKNNSRQKDYYFILQSYNLL